MGDSSLHLGQGYESDGNNPQMAPSRTLEAGEVPTAEADMGKSKEKEK